MLYSNTLWQFVCFAAKNRIRFLGQDIKKVHLEHPSGPYVPRSLKELRNLTFILSKEVRFVLSA